MKNTFFVCLLFQMTAISFYAQPKIEDHKFKYVLFNRAPEQGMSQEEPESINESAFREIIDAFSYDSDSNIKLGICFIFSPFKTESSKTIESLNNFLATAEKTLTPIMIHLDLEQWWNARPDLWNWWDSDKDGYDPANRENVEWTYWSSDHAIKIAWRNWGRQIRVLPPPNLSSNKYLEACREQIDLLIPIVVKWYEGLSPGNKYLFAGIKVGHESSVGVNAYYYPNGNDLLEKTEIDDPQSGIVGQDVLSRGVQQIGYAALKTSGVRTNGDITEKDLYEVVRRYLAFLSRETVKHGITRDKLFTHGAGWHDGEMLYDAALNEYSCPGWSFYAYAKNPTEEPAVKRNLKLSDAPYWGAVEWMLMDNMNADSQTEYGQTSVRKNYWKESLYNTLRDEKARLVCIYNWESIRDNAEAILAIQEIKDEGVGNDK